MDNQPAEAGTTRSAKTKLSRQEQGFNFFAEMFLKLIAADKKIEHKKEVLAYFHDLLEHGGVRNNMIQAFSEFMWEHDKKCQADLVSELKTIQSMFASMLTQNETTEIVIKTLDQFIAESWQPVEYQKAEELIAEVGDLSEVGGGDEDDTPLL